MDIVASNLVTLNFDITYFELCNFGLCHLTVHFIFFSIGQVCQHCSDEEQGVSIEGWVNDENGTWYPRRLGKAGTETIIFNGYPLNQFTMWKFCNIFSAFPWKFRLVATRVLNVRLRHAFAISKKLLWLNQTNVIT